MTRHATPSRRHFLRGLAGLSGVVAARSVLGSGSIVADGGLSELNQAADALEPAVRIGTVPPTTVPETTVPSTTVPPGTGRVESGGLTMPVADLDGGLVCLNNFNGYSNANGPCGHKGVDIGENGPFTVARPLVACVDGVIERDEYAGSGGYMRVLFGDDGRWYRYHHLSSYEEGVEPEDRVVRGQIIGYMGKTGNTQWTHLHFEVWDGSAIPRDGTALDPVPLMDLSEGCELRESTACDASPTG